jgi:hypothetical protein
MNKFGNYQKDTRDIHMVLRVDLGQLLGVKLEIYLEGIVVSYLNWNN